MLTFTATDAGLAGLDAHDATADLVLTASSGTGPVAPPSPANYTVTAVDTAGVVTYTVSLSVPVTATNGIYAVTATVRDRSGNWSDAAATLGAVPDRQRNARHRRTARVHRLASREVTFVATGGAVASHGPRR